MDSYGIRTRGRKEIFCRLFFAFLLYFGSHEALLAEVSTPDPPSVTEFVATLRKVGNKTEAKLYGTIDGGKTLLNNQTGNL